VISAEDRQRASDFLARHAPSELLVVGVTGSHFYGFPSPDSDLDLKGIHVVPTAEIAGLEPPPDTVEWMGEFEGQEVDYTSHEVGLALRLLLKGNGNMLERILSPLQLVTCPEHEELAAIAEGTIARNFFRHYGGFFRRKCEDHRKAARPTAKGLLYIYRAALTGAHLLEAGELVGDVTRLAAEYGFPHVAELAALKRAGAETAGVPDAARYEADLPRLEILLESARARSSLPEEPASRSRVADFLERLRRRHASDCRPVPRAAETVPAQPPAEAMELLGMRAGERARLWRRVEEVCETYWRDLPTLPVAPGPDLKQLAKLVERFDPAHPLAPEEALELAGHALREHQVQVAHPRYFGLFNPAPSAMGVFADALVAAFNPQMASASHSAFATWAERHLVRQLGARFGYDPASCDGTFATGGAEANHTALLTALADRVPGWHAAGLRSASAAPVLYVSREAHHSFVKAARLSGLGTDAVREVAVDEALAMDPAALSREIRADRAAGRLPFLVVATAGTTTAGAVDPVDAVRQVAADEQCWLHVDAAWGGAAALVPELAPLLAGTGRADSITFDAHKWLSVPMGAGLYLTRHAEILERTFRVSAGYMPRDHAPGTPHDPYAHSIQWSRRFIGLKVLLTLSVAGWDGYARVLRHQVAMGDHLRRELERAGWRIANRSPLPVICFDDPRVDAARIADQVVADGHAWISSAKLSTGQSCLRACITSYRTAASDVDALVAALARARERAL